MDVRRLICGLLLASASLCLTSCAGKIEETGCKNLLGSKCIPTEPAGAFTATPNPAAEGTAVTFKFNFSDPDPKDVVTCVFDPEGDGSYQINIACGGGQSYIYQAAGTYNSSVKASDKQGVVVTFTVPVVVGEGPPGIPVTQIQMLDAARTEVTGASVCVILSGETDCTPSISVSEIGGGLYSVTPSLPQDTPAANPFKLKITQGGTPVTVTLDTRVDNDNLIGTVTLITPLDCTTDPANCSDVNSPAVKGTIATLSGVVFSSANGNPVANAQVSISGGNATGGPFATVFTNNSGEFALLVNVGTNLTNAITNSTIRINADGFDEVVSQFAVTPRHFFGLNFFINPQNGPNPKFFEETFEDAASTSQWVIAGGLSGGGGDLDTLWQIVNAGDHIVNTNFPDCVNLAPKDTSNAELLDPVQGTRAFWYGSKATGSFIGDPAKASCSGKNGGSGAAHSGTLTSPVIGLGGVADPLRLTFKTFWEIESVNPNGGGFDLMNIYMSLDNGATFTQIGTLNPLTDPAGVSNRAAIPYTDIGFNAPPLWVQQETIALPGAGGHNIQLRFEFDTRDGAYNGFRSWMIDDIVIEPGQGSLTK